MKKILSIIMICLVGCGCFVGCSSKENTNASKVTKISENKNNPKDIVEEYFKCWNDKNSDKMRLLETGALKKQHKDFQLNNMQFIKLTSCKEWEIHEAMKKAIYEKVGAKEFAKENVKVFTLEFNIKLKKARKEERNPKILQGIITLVRKDKNSTWLIEDITANDDDFLRNINQK